MTNKISSNSIAEIIRQRRSINFFRPETPPRSLIFDALELARWAPNHHLTEPWRFYLLGQETARAIVELNAQLVAAKDGMQAGEQKRQRWLGMPGWLVVTRMRCEDALQTQEDYAACCCAIQNFMLYLWSAGIGTKWTTGPVTRTDKFYDLIWVDRNQEEVVGLIWYGYPEETPVTPRKPLSEVMIELP